MKKSIKLLFILVALVGFQQSAQRSFAMGLDIKVEPSFSSNMNRSLTLKEAIEIAQREALRWNKDAMLFFGLSVDRDESPTGMDGRRKHWNIQFGIPGKTDLYLVTIRDAKVWKTTHLPNELESMPEKYFIPSFEVFKYDSPELLNKGLKITNIYPGDIFAKGYHFGFTKSTEKNMPLVMIIGWDKSRKSMIYLLFNAITGELEEEFEREQYKN
ncbi:hypothetical protein ACFFIS_16505 [Virgibacillus soli]|uniref:Uncharacterized protein n=1 Tax=Paracerasibacillus soli TaxID=480284 RepID=A0ABU5CYB4_9BACI|nr:hypothetical protein [Virgibacillus soli]MDY0410408.1 hypothetical protein [Virgibacillus soli]